MTTIEKIHAIRTLMSKNGFTAYVVPGTDPHASEYMADHWKEMNWLTGFKGETGTAVVTLNDTYLWTDSRYYLQAEAELKGTPIILMKASEMSTPTINQFLIENLNGGVVALNPEMFSAREYAVMKEELIAGGLKLKSANLIKTLWTTDRPAIPCNELYEYDEAYAGESVDNKIRKIREVMTEKGADVLIISALDEIAWLLNVRGTDVEYNPLVISYVILTQRDCTLYIDPHKLTKKTGAYLRWHSVSIERYELIYSCVSAIFPQFTIMYDGSRLNEAIYEAMPKKCRKIDMQSPIMLAKSMKNAVELAGERKSMKQDAVALTKFFYWLYNDAFKSGEKLTEWTLMEKLHDFRAQGQNFVEESFCTIAGYNANGAIVHYSATQENCAEIQPTGVLLLDSGGQYLDGTTDITRTVWLGSDEELENYNPQLKRDYTLVMKGHIALASACFPKGTRGNQLDVLAHGFMWKEGISYGHGTGHGVGHFLGCHEGPQNIRTDNNPAALQIGNICSDEPGIYRAGQYGIRIENLITVVPKEKTEFDDFLCFDTLTLCYYDTRLLDKSILSQQEVDWINAYHKRVADEICPMLDADVAAWLADKCAPVSL